MLQTARSSSCPPPYQGITKAFDSITRTSESTFICPESPSLVLKLPTTRTAPPASSEARAPKSWGRCIHQPQHFPDEEAAKFKARLSAPCKRFGQEKRHLHAGLLITRLKKERQKSSTKSSFGFTNHMHLGFTRQELTHSCLLQTPRICAAWFQSGIGPGANIAWLVIDARKPPALSGAILSSLSRHCSVMSTIPLPCNVPLHQHSQMPLPLPSLCLQPVHV